MPCNINNIQLIDPAALQREMQSAGLPTHQWYGKANSFSVPVEREHGVGLLLLAKKDFAKFDNLDKNNLTLTFQSDGGGASVVFRRLKLLGAFNVLPSDDTCSASVLLLKLADRRYQYRQVAVGQRYNWRQLSGSFDSTTTNSGTPYTWSQLVSNLWDKLRAVYSDLPGTAPAFPATPSGSPEGFDFTAEEAWTALCRVVQAAGYLIRYDPTDDTTTIINPATTAPAEPLAARQSRCWDSAGRVIVRGSNPASFRVMFPRLNRSDSYAATIANPSAVSAVTGSVNYIYSDMPAVGDPVSNTAELTIRATSLATQAGRDCLEYAQSRLVEYYGYQSWAKQAVGYSNYTAWAVYDRGTIGLINGGLKTALNSGSLLVDQKAIPLEESGECSGPCWEPCYNPVVFRVSVGSSLNQVTALITAVTVLTSATTIINRFRNIRIDENGCIFVGDAYCETEVPCTSGDTKKYWCLDGICYTVYDGIIPSGMQGPYDTSAECSEACTPYWCCTDDVPPQLVLVNPGETRPVGCTGTYLTLEEALAAGCIEGSGEVVCAYTVGSPSTKTCVERGVWDEVTQVFERYGTLAECEAGCGGVIIGACSHPYPTVLTMTWTGTLGTCAGLTGSFPITWTSGSTWMGTFVAPGGTITVTSVGTDTGGGLIEWVTTVTSPGYTFTSGWASPTSTPSCGELPICGGDIFGPSACSGFTRGLVGSE